MIPVPIQILGIGTIQTKDHETNHTIKTETIQIIGIEAIQTIETNVTKTIYQEIIHTTNLIISELITITIKIDHEIIHKKGIQIITINKEIILNLLIGIIIVILIPNTSIEATHQNIKDKLIKDKQLKKQLQTPPGIDKTESTELQLNHINCESTDSESDTDNAISINMTTVENDYEPII